jgi:hypothetical protein
MDYDMEKQKYLPTERVARFGWKGGRCSQTTSCDVTLQL